MTKEELILRWMDGEDMTSEQIDILTDIQMQEPEMILNPAEFASVRDDLRAVYPPNEDMPMGELFNAGLMERLRQEELILKTDEVSVIEPVDELEDNVVPFQAEQAELEAAEVGTVDPHVQYTPEAAEAPEAPVVSAPSASLPSAAASGKGDSSITSLPWVFMAMGMAACMVFGVMLGSLFGGKKGASGAVAKYDESIHLSPVVYSANENVSADFSNDGQANVIIVHGLEALPDDLDLFADSRLRAPIKVRPNKLISLETE